MSPFGITTSHSAHVKQVETAKLWMILVGVNKYQDRRLAPLRYSAIDCQGLAEALKDASGFFSQNDLKIHHDFALQEPTLANIRFSLQEVVGAAKTQDTVLFYFSGHAILGTQTEAFLCLSDTQTSSLSETALGVSEVLNFLANCPAKNQLMWLDACHSGAMSLRDQSIGFTNNITPQLVNILQQRAASRQGFYALLSCDDDQQSWEFNELGHGVFTYYLMQGLKGEAADHQGWIYVDSLYRYVYHQTLHYIDKYNQQLRLINQQNQSRGVTEIFGEYTLQTPKRIVEGIGDLIIGKQPDINLDIDQRRLGIVIDGLSNPKIALDISKILRNYGDFDLEYLQAAKSDTQTVKASLRNCLNVNNTETVLVYLRGRIEEVDDWEGFVLGENIRIKRSWLKQQLKHCLAKQIIIFDCIVDSETQISLSEWVQELHVDSLQGQCLIACLDSTPEKVFTQTLLDTLNSHISTNGLSAAGWISQLKLFLAGTNIPLYLWLSGAQGIIEILPVQTYPQKQHSSKDLGVCPYMGLNAFSEQDSLYFHGRETLIQELVHYLSQESFLAVVGASGSGKSSIIQAGIIPALRQGKQIPDSQNWLIKILRPGANPLINLAQIWVGDIHQKVKSAADLSTGSPSRIEGILYQGTESFVYWLRRRPEPILVLVIDQFEELFTLASEKEREEFLELIFGALAYAPDRFKVIITLRADFISSCLEIENLAIALQKFSIFLPSHLSLDDYRRVIVNPAQQVGLQLEPELVEVLLRELNHSVGDLPLLEFVLEQLWQHRVNGQLTLSAYQEKLGGIQGALERSSQAVYDNLDPQMQACAKWIFLSLTQLGEGTEDTRRRVLKTELIVTKYPTDLVDKTLKVLTDAKLVVMNIEDNSTTIATGKGKSEITSSTLLNPTQVTVEVAHEILIRHWSTLRWWLEENRARLRIQRQIEQSAQLWEENDRCSDFLLQGVRLAEAEDIYINYTDELLNDTQQFIAACLQEQQLQKLQAKRRLKMTQVAVIVMSSLSLIACGLASFAYQQSQRAHWEEIKALNSLSKNYLLSHKQLDGLVTAMRASKQLKSQHSWLIFSQLNQSEATSLNTEENLNQAVVNILEKNRLLGHTSLVTKAKFSRDGKFIATASADKTIRLWQSNGKFLKKITGHDDTINDIDFSKDGNLIVSASEDTTIKVWQTNGRLLTTIKGLNIPILGVRFSADGQEIISLGSDLKINFWRKDGQYLRTLPINTPGLTSVNLSPDGETIAIAVQGEIILMNLQGEKTKTLILAPEYAGKISAIAFSPDGRTLTVGTSNGNIAILNFDGKILHQSSEHTTKVTDLAYAPNSQIIASSSTDNTIKLWSMDGTLLETLSGHVRTINNVFFSPDGQTLISASDDKSVRIWKLNTIIPLTLREHQNDVVNINFSPDGQYFASASEDETFNLWRKNGQLVRRFTGHKGAVNNIIFSPDNQNLASVSVDNTIKIWQRDGKLIKTIPVQTDWYTDLAFSPDGKTLAYGDDDYTIKLWHLPSHQMKTLSGHSDSVKSLSYAPNDGQVLVSASLDNKIKLWNANGSLIKTIPAHNAMIWHVLFSPDGKKFASASQDGQIKIWSHNGDLLRTISAHNHEVNKISFSPNSQYIASASDDNTVKIWTTNTGKLVKTLTGHSENVRSISFSQDNEYIVSGGADHTVRIWKFSTLASSKLDFDSLFMQGCNWLGDYLQTQTSLPTEERNLCK